MPDAPTAAEVFAHQRELEVAESNLSDHASYDELSEVARLQNLVWEGQDAVGGVVYRIPAPRVPDLRSKIIKLNERFKKLDLDSVPPLFLDTDEREIENGNWRGTQEQREWAYVVVRGEAPHFHGWSFVATLQHEEGGTILRRVPGQHEIDLGDYHLAPPLCDHCQKHRVRKDTYVVVHEDGRQRQVGRNCLADFIGGLSPERAAKGFQYAIDAIDEAKRTQGEGWTGIAPDPTENTEEYLTHVACMIRNHGWKSKQSAYHHGGVATADSAFSNLIDFVRQNKDRQGVPMWIEPSDEDRAIALDTIDYVRSDEFKDDGDYAHNLKVAMAGDFIKHRNLGLVASSVFVYKRYNEKVLERKAEAERKANGLNEHFGVVVPKGQGKADRHELTLKVMKVYENPTVGYDGRDEVTFITTLEDAEGRTFKWFGSYALEVGKTVKGKWSIKKHSEYQGTKETVLTRPAKLEEIA